MLRVQKADPGLLRDCLCVPPRRRNLAYEIRDSKRKRIAAAIFTINKSFDLERDWYYRLNDIAIYDDSVDMDTAFSLIWQEYASSHESTPTILYPQYEPLSLSDDTIEANNIQRLPNNHDALQFFPFHLIYEMTNVRTGKRYIGQSSSKSRWERYIGSGKSWKEHNKENPSPIARRVITRDLITPTHMHDLECALINYALDTYEEDYLNIARFRQKGEPAGRSNIICCPEEQTLKTLHLLTPKIHQPCPIPL